MAARVTIAARVLATLKGPASGERAVIRSSLGPIAVNVESRGPTSTSSARQSASGWPSAEKVTTGTVASSTSSAPVLVVEVDDAEPAAFRREQLRLGLEVVLHVGVELHVLRAQIGEDTEIEHTGVDPPENQGVAGDLHGDRLDAALAHDREQGLEVGGFGGGALGLDALVADTRLDGSDQSGGPGRSQAALDEVGGGGLAGGTGDADLEQIAARVAVDRGRQFAHQRTRFGDDQHRQPGGGCPFGARRVGQHGDRAE